MAMAEGKGKEEEGEEEKKKEPVCRELSLVQVLSDEALRQTFLDFLRERHTEENLHLWFALEEFNEVRTQEERINVFTQICRTFLLPDCKTPVNYAIAAIQPVRNIYKQLASGQFELPADVFRPLRQSCWDQLLFSCFPPFLESGIYADFLSEKLDTSKVGFSRRKAENFFGMKIEGPLRREEVISVINVGIRHKSGPRFFGMLGKRKKRRRKGTGDNECKVSLEERTSRQVSTTVRNTTTHDESYGFCASDLAKMPNLGGESSCTSESESGSEAPMGIFGLM
uniref:RGS domain-containing protein n=1 Tax=Paramoeba aestuarina TaxID=180227 RepID=A0A7S4UA84_9EUKA|mmetsp:Transcript_38392/g.60823  ORF Transcript_38392/g.60823 Transcript_38392/m.60823 type:complete len:283 (+) Transcript_38392:261-1109(+)|eukprot:CAMPEP_0201524412 /NCGR_PEP_ID=MMETSP0161_2-20130828/21761_1 /ASSEMBLY_ACC=CAM_ASM_000251 /TAXON_ID=180227 /ORGANISM="Neoparamoeba aestuarina, Strain SoJaBio B1-5/56/2" /LENGTH=282 /DNA_ID=CAMNT_0047923787 /DNA_START=279 /DNA_END=1127 /DNA_ORIENTATION=+